jgi:hypothetical protein
MTVHSGVVVCAALAVLCLAACGSPSSSEGERPSGLVGHWRHTDALTSAELTIVTDTNLVLHADGTCVTWTRHEDGGGDPETRGLWRAVGDRLQLKGADAGEWQEAGRFTLDGARLRLVLPNGTVQVFTPP